MTTLQQYAAALACAALAATVFMRLVDAPAPAQKAGFGTACATAESTGGPCVRAKSRQADDSRVELAAAAQPGGIDPLGASRAIQIAFEDCP